MPDLPILVRAARDTVNDETVLLARWAAEEGRRVERGALVAEIETSKSVIETVAPEAGFPRRLHKEGAKVPIGEGLFWLTATADEPLPKAAPAEAGADAASRFSRKALDLMKDSGLSASDFPGEGLVRESDVRAALAKKNPSTRPGVEPLPPRKLAEGRYLAAGQNAGLSSTVTLLCATQGLRQRAAEKADWGGSLTPVLIFESARLLRKHAILNAYYEDGAVHRHKDVNVGVAVDGGQGLVVPVVAGADAKSVEAVAADVQDLMLQYVEGALDLKKLAPGTFTITDLSGEGAFGVTPLINWRQAAILGIGAEFSLPGWPGAIFQLSLTFDHRLTEGRVAAAFLRDLRDRLLEREKQAP